jgi:endonuclease/exonuclease/phosphatase (EEP) superfamily protein YafD
MNFRTVLPVLKARGATWVVFGAATYQSFGHSIHVASKHGSSDPWLLPVSIDGVMLVAFGYATHGRTRAARVLARVILALFMAGVVGINYLAAPAGDTIGQGLSVAPAVGMIATTVLIHLVPKAKAPVRPRRRPAGKNVTSITKARKAS